MRLSSAKSLRVTIGALILAGILAIPLLASPATALAGAPTSETGVPLAANEGDSFLTITDTFDQNLVRDEYLRDIKRVRLDAWERNLPFNGKPIREYLSENFPSIQSADDYANMVKWDSGLEMIAIQRAYESQAHLFMMHIRPNKASIFTANPSFAENIAWGSGSKTDLAKTIQWSNFGVENVFSNGPSGWYLGEIDMLRQGNGFKYSDGNATNGHIRTILDPAYAYHAVGVTHNLVVAGAYSRSPLGNEEGSQWTGEHAITMAVAGGLSQSDGTNTYTSRIETSAPERKTEELAALPTEYVDTDELFVGETRVRTSGVNPVRSYDLVTKTYYNSGMPLIVSMTGAPTSYVLGQERFNEQVAPGTAEVVERGIATKETVDETTREFQVTTTYNHEEPLGFSKVVTEGKNEVYAVTYKVVRGERVAEIGRTLKQELQNRVVEHGTLEKATEQETASTPFSTRYEYDPTLAVGQAQVSQEGRDKQERVTYEITRDTQDGNRVVSKVEQSREVIDEGQEKVVKTGAARVEESWKLDESASDPFETIRSFDTELAVGMEKVTQEGVVGTYEVKVLTYYDANGAELSSQTTDERRVRQPKQDKQVTVGVRKALEPAYAREEIPFKTVTEYDHERLASTPGVTRVEGVAGTKVTKTTRFVDSRDESVELGIETEVYADPEPVDRVIVKGSLALGDVKTRSEAIPVPSEPTIVADETRYEDEASEVPGTPGEKFVTYREVIDTQDGNRVVRTEVLSEKVTKAATATVRTVGTKKRPQALALLTEPLATIAVGGEVSMRVNAEPEGLIRVLLDGEELARDADYTIERGSTIITLTPARTASLVEGEHVLTAEYRETEGFLGGSVSGRFAVSQVAKSGQVAERENRRVDRGDGDVDPTARQRGSVLAETGDDAAPFAGIALLAGAAAAASLLARRKVS